ncbi:nucleoplasmin-2 [Pithys albifrons albifrons]|uniref:nucleoplasmin-2 n=1 Tax=Pithys albifrons albifrons TaxID=3385563 RepID=UPI003A5D2092
MSFSDSVNTRSDKPVSLIWGCELSRQKDSYTFQMPEGWNCEEQLALCTICLGETAQDEFHMVEVMAEQGDTQTTVPLATLKPSVLPMATLAGVELTPPVTFRLRAGSGPVYISGQHLSMVNEEEEEEEMEEEEEEEESPKKSPKGQTTRKGNAAKKRRLEKEDDLNKPDPEDPLPGKGRGAGRSRKAAPKK